MSSEAPEDIGKFHTTVDRGSLATDVCRLGQAEPITYEVES
jgi:hypothetical protein